MSAFNSKMDRKTNKTNQVKSQHCPFLGLRDDPSSHMAFTSPLNYCHGSKSPPTPVKLEHQNAYCLSPAFTECPVFMDDKKKPFPRNLRERTRADQGYYASGRRPMFPLYLLIGLVALGAGYWLLGGPTFLDSPVTPFATLTASPTKTEFSPLVLILASPTGPGASTPSPDFTATLTPFPSLTLVPSPSSTITNTPTQTNTNTPSPTFTVTYTVTPVSSHALDVPIGPVAKYLIHRVESGENLNILAAQYQTSIEAILAVNYTLSLPVWEGALIVIPVEISNPIGLPVFETYQVTYEKIAVEELAAALKTDPVLLKYFNEVQDGEKLHQGDWVLVPRLRTESP